MDFGGRGFIKIAQELKAMGHCVKWYFSVSQNSDFSEYSYSILEDANIEYDTEYKFFLTVDHHKENILKSASRLEQLISQESFDCLLIDRLCLGAAVAASSAGVPWATIGSDGRKWTKLYNSIAKERIISPGESDKNYIDLNEYGSALDGLDVSLNSYWAASPYLNISFFPKCYYQCDSAQKIPVHSHFLGSGVPNRKEISTKKHVLLTFGNTMNDNVKIALVDTFYKELMPQKIILLVLTGSEYMTQMLEYRLPSSEYLEVRSWMPYEQAYMSALIAVGHGGTSHVWTGMNMGVPLIVIPSVGDQWFGGLQVDRLNLGKIISISNKKNIFQRVCKIKTPQYKFNKVMGLEVLGNLLNNKQINDNAKLMENQMQLGGGGQAGAKLLVQLAESKSPVTSCVLGKCCC